jgi:hypothetical protein
MSIDPGLCGDCRHARTVRGARSTFWICGRAASDPSYPRYPALPVITCPGYERLSGAPAPPPSLPPTPPEDAGEETLP